MRRQGYWRQVHDCCSCGDAYEGDVNTSCIVPAELGALYVSAIECGAVSPAATTTEPAFVVTTVLPFASVSL